MGSHFGVGAPPILEPILVGIGMFTGGPNLDFDPWPTPNATETGTSEASLTWAPGIPPAVAAE